MMDVPMTRSPLVDYILPPLFNFDLIRFHQNYFSPRPTHHPFSLLADSTLTYTPARITYTSTLVAKTTITTTAKESNNNTITY